MPLKKANIFTMNADARLMEKTKNYFIGNVVIQDISKVIRSKEQKMYHVTFKNGAKTKMHQHQAGQILVPTGGKGLLVICDKIGQKNSGLKIKKIEEIRLAKGDAVYIPANKLHWHGALGKNTFSHIAINAKLAGYKEAKTLWYESNFKDYAKKL